MPEVDKHMVLVPGFVGFDALGMLRYYAGVTTLFNTWRSGTDARVALHYFDNFPTASVLTRALRLRDFLAKQIARGTIARGDEVTLVGHSTGGLDIRRLLLLLLDDENPAQIDDRFEVANADIRATIKKVVFLSVPHYGTNIADYAAAFAETVKREVASMRDSLALNRPPLSWLRAQLTRPFAHSPADILLALADTLNETDDRVSESEGEAQRAKERESRYALLLWLDHMAHDFSAIEDLCSEPNMTSVEASPAGKPTKSSPALQRSLRAQKDKANDAPLGVSTRDVRSPAHYDRREREEELRSWPPLSVLSYATYVPEAQGGKVDRNASWAERARKLLSVPLGIVLGAQNKLLDKTGLSALAPDVVNGGVGLLELGVLGAFLLAVHKDPPLLFQVLYALCARNDGPFAAPDPATDATYFAQERELRASDNDGIVNTLSMMWPRPIPGRIAHELHVVQADHADIVGHHERVARPRELLEDRRYDAYDIFQSNAGFTKQRFDEVWNGIFAFAAR